jgi:hypothetical protein
VAESESDTAKIAVFISIAIYTYYFRPYLHCKGRLDPLSIVAVGLHINSNYFGIEELNLSDPLVSGSYSDFVYTSWRNFS